MTMTPGRGHEALRRGRWSVAGAEYFLTCCTEARETGLDASPLTGDILTAAEKLTDQGAWRLRTAVVMPDHVHLLFVLGEKADLAPVVRLFKGRLAPTLRTAGLKWQRGYFDHRLRAGEDRLPVFRYIFLNPYRIARVRPDERWPGYFCADEDWVWFKALTDDGGAFPEWLVRK